jgi:hypothetical protein
MLRG